MDPSSSTASGKAELLILGAGTGVPHKERSPSGYLVSAEGGNILIDGGAGTLQRLLGHGITYHDIDQVLYSHFHPDHSLDMVSLLFAAKNPHEPRKKPLRIYGPKGLKQFYKRLLSVYGSALVPKEYDLKLQEVQRGDIELDPCIVTCAPMKHPAPTIGFKVRFNSGATMFYSGDTDYCRNLVSLTREVHSLFLDCSFPDEQKAIGHLTPSLAGKVAAQASCKRLVLTHLYPSCDMYPVIEQCKKHFKGVVVFAKDNMRFELSE